MSLRISTQGQYAQNLAALLQRQSELARTQLQLSSNSRLLRAADDPVGAGVAVLLDHASAELERYATNASTLNHRLNLEEAALTSVGDRLSRIRELAVQASNDTQSEESRSAIVAELREQYAGLVALANSDDGMGRYLFGGSQDRSAPFSIGAGGVSYNGDQVQRRVDIAAETSVADTDPGSEVFMRVRTGNGTFAARAGSGNAGTAVITDSGFTNPSAWDGGSYRIAFDGAGGYQVLDAASAVIATGSYTPGTAISFRGVQVTLNGQPAAGDLVNVQPAVNQDIFATVRNLIDAASAPTGTPAQKAAQRNGFYAAIEDLGQAGNHITDTHASLGARLSTIGATADERSAQSIALKSTLSDLRDLDYAEAASRLSMQLTALQAAQAAFLRVQGSSLFDALRG